MIETLSAALAQQGYETLTPVQEAVTDPALQDADLLVSAQTGSGKTVAFGLAIAATVLGDSNSFGAAGAPLALIIAPTRELAMQVRRELGWLYAQAGAVVTSCVGGMDSRDERRALERGAHIVVATPGRLRDHITRGAIDMTQLRAVVLDEADEMLDLGFREDLEFILGAAPETRRTLMFSATVPPQIAKLAQTFQKDAVRVTTTSETRQHADITYRALTVLPQDAEKAIINLLRFYEAKNAIVFCNTRAAVARLTTRFTNRGFSVVALSGELTQSERSNALQALRDGRARVCVATDVAARGIDLPNLELVVHADLPSNSDTLLHRSGRTGRAGRKGVSALIVAGRMRAKAERLLRMARLTAEWGPAPSAADVTARDDARLLADDAWSDPVPEASAALVSDLIARFDAAQLAAAFVNLYRARQSAPEELSDPGTAPERKERAPFGPGVWFSVPVGRANRAEPRWLLPLLCRRGNITRDDVGAIRINEDHTLVEIAAAQVDRFVSALGPDMTLEDGTRLTRIEGPAPARQTAAPRRPAKPSAPRPDRPAASAPAPRKPKVQPKPQAAARVTPEPAPQKPEPKPAAKPARTERKPMQPDARPKAGARAKSGARDNPAVTPKGTRRAEGQNARAADTSKRFVPPGKAGTRKPVKPGGKPRMPKGGDTRPRRGK
ncbi:MAG: DEAD/DEAH box helicase [Rhodobacteraceae bacterium]|nr:DEAD/DEAH box helicase [Paracoccaceae bacterium]